MTFLEASGGGFGSLRWQDSSQGLNCASQAFHARPERAARPSPGLTGSLQWSQVYLILGQPLMGSGAISNQDWALSAADAKQSSLVRALSSVQAAAKTRHLPANSIFKTTKSSLDLHLGIKLDIWPLLFPHLPRDCDRPMSTWEVCGLHSEHSILMGWASEPHQFTETQCSQNVELDHWSLRF